MEYFVYSSTALCVSVYKHVHVCDYVSLYVCYAMICNDYFISFSLRSFSTTLSYSFGMFTFPRCLSVRFRPGFAG